MFLCQWKAMGSCPSTAWQVTAVLMPSRSQEFWKLNPSIFGGTELEYCIRGPKPGNFRREATSTNYFVRSYIRTSIWPKLHVLSMSIFQIKQLARWSLLGALVKGLIRAEWIMIMREDFVCNSRLWASLIIIKHFCKRQQYYQMLIPNICFCQHFTSPIMLIVISLV